MQETMADPLRRVPAPEEQGTLSVLSRNIALHRTGRQSIIKVHRRLVARASQAGHVLYRLPQ